MLTRFIVIVTIALHSVVRAESLDLSLEEFKMFQHYRNALEDPRVQKMKPEARLGAIAKDAGFKVKDLQRAIERGERAGNLKVQCEQAVRGELEKTELSGRVGKVDIDTENPHAVAYVMWLNEDPTKLDQESSLAAASTIRGCPIVSTIQIWSQAKDNPKVQVFQALISESAAKNIKFDRIKDFATTRYMRLFEKVKSVNHGDSFQVEPSATSPAQPTH